MSNELKEAQKRYDSKNVFESITLFPEQCAHAWQTANYTPKNNTDIQNILVIGMGGSALGAYIIQSLNILSVPLSISHDYTIPAWVNEHTLVLAMSYSGTTEETLSATEQALAKNALVVGITTGGTLKTLLENQNQPVCIIDASKNPCGQPRFGVGSMMMIMLNVFLKHNLISLSQTEIQNTLTELEKLNTEEDISKIFENTKKLKGSIPVLVLSEHLTNVGRFIRNQIHETSKTLALTHEIPELNHHLMEGLLFPTENTNQLDFIFFVSEKYSSRIQKRFAVTKDVLEKQNIKHSSVLVKGDNDLTQALWAMLYGMYVAYAFSLINEQDPSNIPWVNYFKEELKK